MHADPFAMSYNSSSRITIAELLEAAISEYGSYTTWVAYPNHRGRWEATYHITPLPDGVAVMTKDRRELVATFCD